MKLPRAVITGRPNVGKSSLFNRIVGRRAAVVANRDGVTRDRHYQDAEWHGHRFCIVDTGGFMSPSGNSMLDQVQDQIESALDEATLVLFVIDGLVGVTAEDEKFAKMVLRKKAPVILLVNKSEKVSTALDSHEAWSLGMGQPYPVSALSGFGMNSLLEEVTSRLPEVEVPEWTESELKLAVLGRPNAGKSTLVNSLLGEERLVTSDVPGTTRDSIDSEFEYKGFRVVLTDTAGLRKKAKVHDEVEYFSNMRAIESIRRGQICILLVDALLGLSEQDLRICQMVKQEGRGLFLILNKWDLADTGDQLFDKTVKEIRRRSPELEGVPFLAISALTGKRVHKILDQALIIKKNMEQVLGREEVIKFFEETIETHPHPGTSQGMVNLKRCCQVMVDPVALAIETPFPKRVVPSYVRYLRRKAMNYFALEGVPLRIWFRSKFQLRTDEELKTYLQGHRQGFEEWKDEPAFEPDEKESE